MNRIRIISFVGGLLFLFGYLSQAEELEKNFKKENLKLLVEGHEFTEGPTLDGQGNLLFTSPKQNSIIKYTIADQSNSVFYKGDDPVSALFFSRRKALRNSRDTEANHRD